MSRRAKRCMMVSVFILLGGGLFWFYQVRPRTLISGKPAMRPSPGDGRHRYAFEVPSEQFAYLELEQEGVDVEISLFGPDGEKRFWRDSVQGTDGVESLGFLAPAGGRHILEVRAFRSDDRGAYRLLLHGPRVPDDADRARARASAYFHEAMIKAYSDQAETWPEAEEEFNAAAKAWLEANENLQAAVALWHQGLLWGRRGNPQRKLHQYREVVSLLAETGETSLQTAMLHNLGVTSYHLRRIDEAIAYFDRALARRGAPTLDRAASLQAKASAYRFAGSYEEALELLKEAEEIQRALGTPFSLAKLHNDMGTFLSQTEQPGAAIPHFEKALGLITERDRLFEVGILDRLAQAHSLIGQYDRARKYHERALARLPSSEESRKGALLCNLGVTLLQGGDPSAARSPLQDAAARFKASVSQDELLYALHNLARVESALGMREEALDHIESALDLMEEARLSTRDLTLRRDLTAIRYAPLEVWADLVLDREAVPQEELRNLLERLDGVRAGSLVEAIERPGSEPDQGSQWSADLEDLAGRINELEWRQGMGWGEGSRGDEGARERTRLLRRFDQTQPLTVDTRERPASFRGLEFAQMRQFLKKGEDLLLFYVLGERRAYVLRSDGEAVSRFDVGSRKEIEADVLEYLALVRDREPALQRERLTRYGPRLNRLLPPGLERENTLRRLIIVADGNLHYLPFASIPALADGKPLVSRFEIVHLPSIAALAALSGRQGEHGAEVAVFADPARLDSDPPGLPFAGQEAEMIAALIPEAMLRLGTDAGKNPILAGSLTPYRLIHFATHGLLHSQRYELSALVLAGVDENGVASDKFLRAQEIAGLDLNADLVVLSACESGLGEEVRGEGLVGLPRAFLQAGAASVLVSLWRIDDEATMALMRYFYRSLILENASPVEALQTAQRAMSESDSWRDPYYWAGFRLIGDWRWGDRSKNPAIK